MTPLQKQWLKDAFSILARATLAAAFLWACVHKIGDPADFALQTATYQILPLSLINFQAIALPFVELIAGVLLIVGYWTRPAALVTIGMNIMFIAAIAMALKADLQLQCGCFASSGAGEEMSMALIVRDVAFLLVAAVLIFLGPDRFTVDNLIAKRRRFHA
jgi:uncharacterized membrane protein YphA (DoxX/SURF4 family)